MKRKQSQKLRVFGLAALFCLSLSSFIYINNVELNIDSSVPEINIIYADDLEETNEVLPELHLIKKVMHKAFEFII